MLEPGKRSRPLLAALVCLVGMACGDGKVPTLSSSRKPVAETDMFTFHNNFWLNLHDFLYERAQYREAPSPPDYPEILSAEEIAGWEAAEKVYAEDVGRRSYRLDTLTVAMRLHLVDLSWELEGQVPAVEDVMTTLRQAAPVYLACWWPEHRQRNQAWIDSLVALLNVHEDLLRARLSRHYQEAWPSGKIPVDVAGYAGRHGANTTADPNHVMISSVDPGYKGYVALEMVFHESSHTIVGSDTGKIAHHLHEASEHHDVQLPRRLWHAILFYTAGKATQKVLAESGVDDYVPYSYAQGLMERGHKPYREALEAHWQAYLDGKSDLRTAVFAIVGELKR